MVLTVSDNGRGFDILQKSAGHGLLSMRERTEGLRGRLEIGSSENEGTMLSFAIPLSQHDETSTAVGARSTD